MNIDDMIAVLRAQIEERFSGFPPSEWNITTEPKWNFDKRDYRVAPEPPKPREWKVRVNKGDIYSAWPEVMGPEITVREVIGASSGNPTVASDAEALGTISGHRAMAADTASYNPK